MTSYPMTISWGIVKVRMLHSFCRVYHLTGYNRILQRKHYRNFFASSQLCSGDKLDNFKVNRPPKSSSSEDDKLFKPIYLFKHIIVARVLSRLKIYQTGITLFLVPYSSFLYLNEVTSVEVITGIFSLATVATISLYVISGFTQNIVGIISVSNDDKNVRISRLTFWGKRVDEVFKADEIIPFSESDEEIKKDIYKIIKFYTNDRKFYLFTAGVKVVDTQKLETLIGPIR